MSPAGFLIFTLVIAIVLVVSAGVWKLVFRLFGYSLSWQRSFLLAVAVGALNAIAQAVPVMAPLVVVGAAAMVAWLGARWYHASIGKGILLYIVGAIMTVIVSLLIIIPMRMFIVQPLYITGDAMEPALSDQDYVLVNMLSNDYQAGDIIVHRLADDPATWYVKRIAVGPGETIETEDGSMQLADNEYYVLGDNAEASTDSRDYGPITHEQIIGEYLLTLWSL